MNMSIKRIVTLLAAAALLAGLMPGYAVAGGMGAWEPRSPLPTTLPLTAAAYGNGIYVAVGDGGTIIRSTDGTDWTSQHSASNQPLSGVAFGGGRFVAVGSAGTILSSEDGASWESRTSGVTQYLQGITFGGGQFVAVGSSGTVLTSVDGETWTQQISGTDNELARVAYGNGLYVAGGGVSTVLVSEDGENWDSYSALAQLGFVNINGLAHDGVQFILSGSFIANTIAVSVDGVNWTPMTIPGGVSLRGVAYGNGVYVAVGYNGAVLSMVEGEAWTSRTSGTNQDFLGAAYVNDRFIAVGINGALYTSADGITWTSQFKGTRMTLNHVVYGGGQYVAVGAAGTIVTSDNGKDWTSRETATIQTLNSVAYANGRYVAVGYDTTILISDDGAEWTQITVPGSSRNLTGVAYGNGLYVATVHYSTVMTSVYGETWVEHGPPPLPGGNITGLAFGSDVFVAVGDMGGAGAILSSTNPGVAADWHPRASGVTNGLQDVAYGEINGDPLFVAVGSSGAIVTSPDGVNWTLQSSGVAVNLSGVTYVDGMFMAVGASGTILISTDGENWTVQPSGMDLTFTGAAANGSSYVVVGSDGKILRSAYVYKVQYNANGADEGSAPVDGNEYEEGDSVTVLGNTGNLVKEGYQFAGWNTQSDGEGTAYEPGDILPIGGADVTLYAVWEEVGKYTVAYEANGADEGTVPTDGNEYEEGDLVTVLGNTGNLVKAGYQFAGWNTQSDGEGTAYEPGDTFPIGGADVTLYAVWSPLTVTVPPAPANVTATAGDGQVALSWSSVAEASSYKVYVSTESGVYGQEPEATVAAATYTVTGLTNGETYYFIIMAWNSAGDSPQSNEVSAAPQADVVPAPLLTAVAAPGHAVGTTSVTADVYAGNHLVIAISSSFIPAPNTGDAAPVGPGVTNPYASGTDISGVDAVVLKYAGVYEVDGDGKIVKFRLIELTAGDIRTSDSNEPGDPTDPTDPTDPANPGNPGSSGSNPTQPGGVETITVNVENGTAAGGAVVMTIEIRRTTDATGKKKDEVTFTPDQVSKSIAELSAAGSSSAKMVIPDPGNEVAETTVTIPAASAGLLARDNIDLEIYTGNARILIPHASLLGLADDVYFRVVPIRQEEERMEVEQRARAEQKVREAAGRGQVEIVGVPMTIETNMHSRTVALVLPLEEAGFNDNQLQDMGVFIEHSDGETKLVKGSIVAYNETGKRGIEFVINKFSTFTIVYVEGWQDSLPDGAEHKAYIFGYADGTFRPDAPIVRGEMASILSRLFANPGQESTPQLGFRDVDAGHWASAAIAEAAALELMIGYADGSFRPDSAITRAELSVILSRLTGDESRSGQGFPDTEGHWAQQAVKSVQAAGLIQGYADGAFRPDQTVTRAETVAMLNRLLGREPIGGEASWTDVPQEHWAFGHIQAASVDHVPAALQGP